MGVHRLTDRKAVVPENGTKRPSPRRGEDGIWEFDCPVCGHLTLRGIFTGWVEGFCTKCRKRRGFKSNSAS